MIKKIVLIATSFTAPLFSAEQLTKPMEIINMTHAVKAFKDEFARKYKLHISARDGDINNAQKLLNEGYDINQREENLKETPLMEAASAGQVDMVRFLIDHKASFTEIDCGGRTALHIAAFEGNENVVELLVDRGAPLNLVDRDGQKAAMLATFMGKDTIAKFLIKKGEIVPQHFLDTLTQRDDLNLYRQKYPLHHAALSPFTKELQELLDNGYNLEQQDEKYGRTPLQAALCTNPIPHMIRFLLSKGASTNIQDKNGETAIVMAQRTNNPEIKALFEEHQMRVISID